MSSPLVWPPPACLAKSFFPSPAAPCSPGSTKPPRPAPSSTASSSPPTPKRSPISAAKTTGQSNSPRPISPPVPIASTPSPNIFPADIYVNIQGDEPLLKPEHLTALLRPFAQPHVVVSTLKVLCTRKDETNPNAVKVVTAADGRALYFSRATIPYDRDWRAHDGQARTNAAPEYWKHIGLYAYRKATLDRFPTLPPSALEQTERLEQLRFLENGIDIHVEPTPYDTIGVDTEEDLHRVEALLRR